MKTARLFLTIAAISLSAAALAHAENTKPYQLKNRSEFKADAEARIPFWPIGFVRPPVGTATVAAAPVVAKIRLEPDQFNVTSILLGNPPLATINGRSFSEGELLPVVWGNERLRVVLRAVRDGAVTLEYEDQVITVPMRRVEIGARVMRRQADPAQFLIHLGPSNRK